MCLSAYVCTTCMQMPWKTEEAGISGTADTVGCKLFYRDAGN